MNEKFEHTLVQTGVVLSRYTKAPTREFKNEKGDVIAAKPERYYVKVAVGAAFSQEDGYLEMSVVEFEVTKEFLSNVKYNTPVVATIKLTNFGARAVKLELKNELRKVV